MSTDLATKLYENIGKIKHLRTFEFLKAIQQETEADGYARITYAKWRDVHGIHAFILNECTRECEELGFIEVARQDKAGEISEKGGKGTRRLYRLTLDSVKPAEIQKPDSPSQAKVEAEKVPVPNEPAIHASKKKVTAKKPSNSKQKPKVAAKKVPAKKKVSPKKK